jgi:hypothetical protein
MRIWTVHPRYLDARGLVALWREALLAQAVLRGETRGYTRHPQLERFRAQPDPLAAIAAYLTGVHDEASGRGYRFDATKIGSARATSRIAETRGQLEYEWAHLLAKLQHRAPELRARLRTHERIEPHPLFRIVAGGTRAWEKPVRGSITPLRVRGEHAELDDRVRRRSSVSRGRSK